MDQLFNLASLVTALCGIGALGYVFHSIFKKQHEYHKEIIELLMAEEYERKKRADFLLAKLPKKAGRAPQNAQVDDGMM